MKSSLESLLILFFVFFTAHSQAQFSTKTDSLLQAKSRIPFSGVILVSKNGKKLYSKVDGYKNFTTKVPLKENDQFEIMSNSKLFTSVLVLLQVEKGKIDLQSPIKKYLPNLTQSWADSVTVHQLLNHTHGIVDVEKPLLFKSGTDFKYGNLSNVLLGKIIEKVTGKTYRENATELFKKLKMKNTFCYSKDHRQNLVDGHFIQNSDHFNILENSMINEENLPADGIISNAYDLSIWDEALHNGKILKPSSYKLITTSSALSQHDVFGKEKKGYGYNIRIVEENGIPYIGHTGLGDGFSSMNIYFPKTKVSLIILENLMPENSDDYYFFETKIKNELLKTDWVKK